MAAVPVENFNLLPSFVVESLKRALDPIADVAEFG
jgi:hypothetical protein